MPILETIVAQPVAQPAPGATPDVSLSTRVVGRGIEDLSQAGLKIAEAEAASKTRRASAAAERELYDLADELNNSTDHETAEATYATKSSEILERYRGQLTGSFYQDAFDESAGAFNDRMVHAVRSGVRTKRIDASKAGLDEELGHRTELFSKLWDDPDARDEQRLQFYGSVDIQRASGLITESEAVNYRQGFDAAAQQATDTQVQQARIHHRVLEVMASAPDRKAALAEADKSDPDIAQDVFNRVSARFSSQEAGNEVALRQMKDRAYPALEQAFFNGYQYGPGEHDVVPPGPEAAYYVLDNALDVPASVREKLDNHISALSQRQRAVDEPAFARVYDRYVSLRDNKATREQFLTEAEDLPTVRLKYPNFRTQIDALIADAKNMTVGLEPTATETKRANELYAQMFDVRLTEGGNAKHPKDRERLAQFRLAYELAYQEETKITGKRLDRDQELKLATRLLKQLPDERYQFELPPRRTPVPGALPGTGTPARGRPARPDQPAPARVPPRPSHATPYVSVHDNPDLALRAELALTERGEAPTSANVLAEMNRLRGAARE